MLINIWMYTHIHTCIQSITQTHTCAPPTPTISELYAALAEVAQWTERWPENQRVAGSIPSLGHMPGLQAMSSVGVCKRQLHTDVSLPLFLPPFPSLIINK